VAVACACAITTAATGSAASPEPPGRSGRAEAVPAGAATSAVASVPAPTAIETLPDGRVVVLEQDGRVRLIVDGALRPAPALALGVCANAPERGLLGFTSDPDLVANGRVYLYYTRFAPGSPGGCVNRVSRFTMAGDVIDASSEVVLLDGISSVNGNHNGGDLDIGRDGHLYVSTGDAGRDPRGDSGSAGSNDAAQDLSLLNGKILRVDRTTGEGVPGNPLIAQGAVSCRVRGNTPATPSTPCAEIYAWGLRNPYRFAFDTNTGPQRFFVNDVGQGAREEVDDGILGADYGWNAREGSCPRGQQPPCAGPPPGITDPLTDYPRSVGTYITAGAFVPNGTWPAAYDGAYLFADGGTGKIFLRRADGGVDYAAPFATGAGVVADMTFVREPQGMSLWYTVAGETAGSVRRITFPWRAPAPSPPLSYAPLDSARRILDTRLAAAGAAPVVGGTTRHVVTGVDGSTTRAVLVSIAMVAPSSPGFVTAWAARAPMPPTANANAAAGEIVNNLAIVPVDELGGMLLFSYATSHLVVDLLGSFEAAPGAVTGGRFQALDPSRLADTREAVGPVNRYERRAGSPHPVVRVPVLGRAGVPTSGVASVVAVVTGISGAQQGGGFATATPAGAPWPGTANLNTAGSGDVRPNTVVVPVGADGSIDVHLYEVADVVVDVAGWFTSSAAPASTSGRFVSLPPTREADTRSGQGFGRFGAGDTRVLDPASVPADAAALAHNVAIVDNAGPGFLTPFPGGPRPFVAAGNVTAPGQIRAILTVTALSPSGTMSYYSYMPTDLVVDVTGWFQR